MCSGVSTSAPEHPHLGYNKADQLVKWPGMDGNATNAGYTYDGAGNLHEVYNAKSTPEQIADYTYTYAGLLNTATYKGADGNNRTLSNTWDASANRVSFTAASTTHTFVYDPTAGIPAVIQEDGIYYFREPNGSLVAQKNDTAWHYYHFDELGSTRLLTDGNGDISDKYSYDAYGKLLWREMANANSIDQPYQYVGQLGYYTHYQEPHFSLIQVRKRLYDCAVGRFTQHGSPYTFASNSPVTLASIGDIIVILPPFRDRNPDEIDADIREAGYGGTYCALNAQRAAQGMVEKYYQGKEKVWGDTLANAVMHCTLTCTIAAKCGRSTAVTITNNHEKYNWNPKTGVMDLGNNKEGLNCFDRTPSKCPDKNRDDTKGCLDCCLKRRASGNLHLPPNVGTPNYPGGN
ncbi:MAG: hypothetical protein M1133_02465 [Armatimonadetes bacterium]|nr:hypothetical protein [Armatimonadota bacterium]